MAAAAVAQTNSPRRLKVWFGDGTGLDIHTESPAPTACLAAARRFVPAGYDFHACISDKQGALLSVMISRPGKPGQGTLRFGLEPVDTDKIKVGGLGKWLEISNLTALANPPLRTGRAVESTSVSPVRRRIYDVLKIWATGRRRTPHPNTSGEGFPGECPREHRRQDHRGTPEYWMREGIDDLFAGRGESYLALSRLRITPSGVPAG